MTMAECVTRSCTTGWLDWIHGELWLTPTGLIPRDPAYAILRTALHAAVGERLHRANVPT